MTFRSHPQHFQIPFPYKGIDNNAENDFTTAKFIQNMLVGDNKTGHLRYGTSLVSEFAFDANRAFRDPIAIMNFYKSDGTTEVIIYVQYLTVLEDLNIEDDVTLDDIEDKEGYTRITIDISSYNDEQKAYFKKVLFDNVYLFTIQTHSDGAFIENVMAEDDTIVFDIPLEKDFFDLDELIFRIERAGIYRVVDSAYELILDDLDPVVIVSHINFQGKLLIANGVDTVKVYDGENVTELKGPASIPTSGNISIDVQDISFDILQSILSEMQDNIKIGTVLTLLSDEERKEVTITNIVYDAPVDGSVHVTITVDDEPEENIRKIFYDKVCPPFSYLCIAHRRLWALPEGRAYQNKFRPPELAQKIYYTTKINSIDSWFDEQTNQLRFIDISSTSNNPDNVEAMIAFEGAVVFLGRRTTQIWLGEDPTTPDDGQNIVFPDFKWDRTFPVGLYQRNLMVEVPGNLLFMCNFGTIASINSQNISRQIDINYNFSLPINHHLTNQLAFVETDRDYISMQAFLYPYGRFLGFRIKYSCFIYQINNEGAWCVFSENFAESKSFLYDPTSKNLYLGLEQGKLIVYADKIKAQSYEEYDKGKISWLIQYNWLYPGSTWFNSTVYIGSRSLKPLTVLLRFFLDLKEDTSVSDEIVLQQRGALFNVSRFNSRLYPYSITSFAHELSDFNGDCLMTELSGLSNDAFTFDRLILCGGTQGVTDGS